MLCFLSRARASINRQNSIDEMLSCSGSDSAPTGMSTAVHRCGLNCGLDFDAESIKSPLRGMAGTTRLELATSAVTVSWLQILSTTWKSTDGTASHWKYMIGNVIVYRHVYRGCSVNRTDRAVNFRLARYPGIVAVSGKVRMSACKL